MSTYQEFLESKRQKDEFHGFEPLWMPDFLYPFQTYLTDWAIKKGRAALFEDCGLGKTPQALVWAMNVVRKTNKPVLILTPLAVAPQFVREGEKFGIEVNHCRDGVVKSGINVVNYHRLHYFNPSDFAGLVCDESSCLKHQDAKTRYVVTEFASKIPYCLLGTATPAPNDFMELGNSAEALGVMQYSQVLSKFFTNDGESTQRWRLRGHAKRRFWEWVSGWARAMRKPSDLGFGDDRFILPPLSVEQHVVESPEPTEGLLVLQARTLNEQRAERRKTLNIRCEKVASLIPKDRPFIVWCHLNTEGDLLEGLIPDAVQVAGRHSNREKEERLDAFSQGKIRVLVSKSKIAGWGLNWQHCSDISYFPSHSFESWYQSIRRCWRFGQKREVKVHIVTSEAESLVLSNMQRKEKAADELYDGIVRGMSKYQTRQNGNHKATEEMESPLWL